MRRLGAVVAAVLMLGAGQAHADLLIATQEPGYRYCACTFAPGMESSGFDDSGFQVAKAPFCNLGSTCSPFDGTVVNVLETVVRKHVVLTGTPLNPVLTIRFHSAAVVYVNGRRIGSFGNGCAEQSNSTRLDVPDGLLRGGDNVITVEVVRSFNDPLGFFDLMLEAEGATAVNKSTWGNLKSMYR